ncbi:MAG: MFS transporter [Methylovirgula sp.]
MRNASSPSLGPRGVVATLGPLQILAWGSTFYLLGVLAQPIASDTGWPLTGIVTGLSVALLAAGLIAPFVGRRIASFGGRPVLATGSALMAAGLAVMSLAPNLFVYLLAWAITGCGMGAGLYDPAFSTLGQLYGRDARRLVTAVTLFGGFASTVAWPTTAYLLSHVGWRATCGIYAAMEIGVAMPCYLLLLPRRDAGITQKPVTSASASHDLPPRKHALALLLLGTLLTLGAALLSLISTHLLTMLCKSRHSFRCSNPALPGRPHRSD